MDVDEQSDDAFNLWTNDALASGDLYIRKNIAHFKETLVDILDHLPHTLQLDATQRENLIKPLTGFNDLVYMMNPVAVVAGYVAVTLARNDNVGALGALESKHIQQTMDIFGQYIHNRALSAYDIIRYALAYNRGSTPRIRPVEERRV